MYDVLVTCLLCLDICMGDPGSLLRPGPRFRRVVHVTVPSLPVQGACPSQESYQGVEPPGVWQLLRGHFNVCDAVWSAAV
jgi:hypothetical protein